ncbi:ABC transporter permease [Halorussus gelatinilyticus]|uniref:ABC transporter permease n=1 Tax=Halorussus gelatinilyticus TaxID=2937524 RepID=A0A8U0IL96_9EURY|nr:ABC transporter permease [Halorussus gelatinilyticus]UPW01548.1 ABC transporter permease [Halorussus gelatinilyticus]
MEFAESLRFSWRSIKSHKLRSTLTTLGIVIGVAAVITFVTLGTSLRADVLGQVGADRTPNVYVWAGPEGQEGGPGAGSQPVFTTSDVDALRNVSGVESVIPRGVVPTAAVSAGGETVAQRQVVATSPSYFDDGAFVEGRAFRQGSREVVLNQQAANLFDPALGVGQNVTLRLASGDSIEAEVVGLLNGSSGGGAFEGLGSSQPLVFVPTDPFYRTTIESPTTGESQRVYPTLTVVAEDFEAVPRVKTGVRSYLENRSDAARLVPDDYAFSVETDQDLVDRIKELLTTLTNFITGIAVISLVVGSIGIANIMLVSVTERTKEIGIMKSVGAQNRDILQLFLLEAVMLGLFGALLGIPVGIGGAYAAGEYIGLSLVLPYEWFAVAVAVGILVGVVAGLYPAWSAAKTDPIDALRYE